jgi:hypothetical protein
VVSEQSTGIVRMSHCYVMLHGGRRSSTLVWSLGQRAFGHGSWAKRSLAFAVFVACSQSHLEVNPQVRNSKQRCIGVQKWRSYNERHFELVVMMTVKHCQRIYRQN